LIEGRRIVGLFSFEVEKTFSTVLLSYYAIEMKKIIILLVLLTAIGASGPLFCFRPDASGALALPGVSAANLDAYLFQSEKKVDGLKRELAKGVLWADQPYGQVTPFSIVYLHGFSASRKDIYPVVETLAQDLHANVFFSRLKAHGLNANQAFEAFSKVKASDWYDDAREAMAVGQIIGQKVVLVGTSTGALLATILALDPVVQKNVAALILLSPNFGIADWRGKYASGPFGKYIAQGILGKVRDQAPTNLNHSNYWTLRYPTEVLAQVMDLANYGREMNLLDLSVPTLFLYTEKDDVIDLKSLKKHFESIADQRKQIHNIAGANRHELTGYALVPETVPDVLAKMRGFLRENNIFRAQ
jgi:esterase/lipase